MQQKKTRRGREYLNDFRRDVNGSYLYQGSYRRYTGSMPYAKLRGLLWALCGGEEFYKIQRAVMVILLTFT